MGKDALGPYNIFSTNVNENRKKGKKLKADINNTH